MGILSKVRKAFTPHDSVAGRQPRHVRSSRKRLPYAVMSGLVMVAYYAFVLHEQIQMEAASPHIEGYLAQNSRKILSEFSILETLVGLVYDGTDLTDCENPIDWALVAPVYIGGSIYLFLGLAVICDDYFVASLENISETLRLTDDVAGATFMAAGSSAPELFTSMMGTLVFVSDVGIGTIVGSAIFNILVIVGLTILLSGNRLVLDWKPLTRDCGYYGFSIVLLIACFADGGIQFYEAIIFVLAYCGYIFVMVINPSLMGTMTDCQLAVYTMFLGRKVEDSDDENEQGEEGDMKDAKPLELSDFGAKEVDEPADDDGSPTDNFGPAFAKNNAQVVPLNESPEAMTKFPTDPMAAQMEIASFPVHANPANFSANHAQLIRDAALMAPKSTDPRIRFKAAVYAVIASNRFSKFVTSPEDVVMEAEMEPVDDVVIDDVFIEPPRKTGTNIFKKIGSIIIFILSLPYKILFIVTVPDCARGGCWYWWFPFTFTHSIIWIGILSFFMVDFASRAGCVMKIPDIVMGLTFIAAGTSVPDALSSVSVAKDGMGDMAVANAIGSNVFDICFGLGLPWFIKTIAVDPLGTVEITSNTWETVMFAGLLFFTLFGFYGVIAIGRFTLTPRIGYIFLTVYFIFMIWAIVWAYAIRPLCCED